MVYRTALFSKTLNDPYPGFQGYAIFYAEYSETVRDTNINLMEYYGLTYALLNSVISNDLE